MHAFDKGLFWVIQIALVVLLAAYGGQSGPLRPVSVVDVEPVYLVGQGWHAGIVIRRTDATAAWWPEQDDFPDATFLEVGWGDRVFYQNPDPGVGKMLKAGLWPTRSVLHVVGFRPPVTDYFPASEVIRIDLPEAGVDSLAAFIHAAYARDEAGQPIALGPGSRGMDGPHRGPHPGAAAANLEGDGDGARYVSRNLGRFDRSLSVALGGGIR